MVPNVRYYWIPELANYSCPNHTISNVNHFIHYLSLLQRLRGSEKKQTICEHTFVIPIIVDTYSHRFEVYTLVSEIHENVDLVLGIKNVFELEGVVNSWECCFSFLNRSTPLFPKEKIILKPKEQKLVKVEAPFIDEISGLAIVRILEELMQSTMMLKLKFTQNLAMLDIMNSSSEIVILNAKEAT